MLLVDVSSSGAFGTADKLKNEVAAELAAILAYTAIKNNDRVGLIIFSDRVEHYIPPKKGRSHVWRVIREILGYRPTGRSTDLAGALEYMSKVSRRHVVAFVISDFLDQGFEHRLRVAAKRHEVTAICVADRRESKLPSIGLLELEDAETGEVMVVDTYDRKITDGLQALVRQENRERSDLFRSAGVGQIDVSTDHSYVDAIVQYFRARGH